MQQLYVLRRFSSWSFRLSVSVALLASSAGLAATLLVGAAIGNAAPPGISWQATGHLARPASELASGQPFSEAVLPESLSSLLPAYSFASSTTVDAPLLSPASYRLPAQPASADSALGSTAGSLKSTVQRFWHTFKQAFQ